MTGGSLLFKNLSPFISRHIYELHYFVVVCTADICLHRLVYVVSDVAHLRARLPFAKKYIYFEHVMIAYFKDFSYFLLQGMESKINAINMDGIKVNV